MWFKTKTKKGARDLILQDDDGPAGAAALLNDGVDHERSSLFFLFFSFWRLREREKRRERARNTFPRRQLRPTGSAQ